MPPSRTIKAFAIIKIINPWDAIIVMLQHVAADVAETIEL